MTTDAALVALHDCDNDTDRAAIMLLEGNQDEVMHLHIYIYVAEIKIVLAILP